MFSRHYDAIMYLICAHENSGKTTFFRQRQQKSIFGQVFKQKFSDQKSAQDV